jgi:lipopolysaccharide/colanic/teichoic acid biosynthesis glycosyltransferase
MDADQYSKIDYFDALNAPFATQLRALIGALFKRVFDVVMSLVGLLVLSPLFIFVVIKIRREKAGPVFYQGPRIGKGGKLFQILKFRTMYETPESYDGPHITSTDDVRVTPLGHWLRNTKINELPQLWNVLIGEMSLVGPRPEDPDIAAKWPAEAFRTILSVRPGITSPASISYHDEESLLSKDSFMDAYVGQIMPDKLRLDCLYVRHHSFLGDLDVIFLTLLVLVPRLSRKPLPEGWLFGGPFSRVMRTYVNWFVIDFLVAFAGVGLVGLFWRLVEPLEMGFERASLSAAVLALLFGFVNSVLGLKRVVWSRAAAEDVFGLFVSCLIVMSVGVTMEFVFHWPNFPNGFLAVTSVVVLFGFVIARYRFRLITGLASRWANWRGVGFGIGEQVLIIGAGQAGEFASWLLRRPDFLRMFSIVGYIDDDPEKQGMRIDGLRVLGTTADIPHLVRQYDIGVIFYAIGNNISSEEQRIFDICKIPNVHIVSVVDVLGKLRTQLTQSSGLKSTEAEN